MSSTSTYATPLQAHHLSNLILILRRANARYSHLAACVRSSFTPTRHAKSRAQKLRLTVDITAAVNCPQREVSNIPLPIIEIVSPLPVVQKRPVLTCTIPNGPVMQTITSPNGTTSALSTASAYSAVTLTSAKPANAVRSHWSVITDDEDFPRDVTARDARSVRAVAQTDTAGCWQPLNVPIDEEAMVWELDLQYTQDSTAMDISPSMSASSVPSTVAILSPLSPSSGSEAGSESSETSDSSTGPVTPPSSLPLIIRIKRKSMENRDVDEIDAYNMSDKRVRVH
ncbi:hypothetical protein H0H87_011834 [Tephrocybe sp. NHM501043]|nr:hypothetical protein H0H87_011834 [Tephrocybe sp. NHM501043]